MNVREGDSMSNIADLIEAYIRQQLAQQQDGKVELRRTDIADKISCAPSQISYVLSTRFTQDKGFVVESRRGLGGFIRIVQIPDRQQVKNMIYEDMRGKITGDTTYGEVEDIFHYLQQHELITPREASLAMQVATALFHSPTMDVDEKVQLIQGMLTTLEKFS